MYYSNPLFKYEALTSYCSDETLRRRLRPKQLIGELSLQITYRELECVQIESGGDASKSIETNSYPLCIETIQPQIPNYHINAQNNHDNQIP